MKKYSNNQSSQEVNENNAVDLVELLRVLYSAKWFILGLLLLFSTTSFFYSLNVPDTFRSEALLSPTEQEGSVGLSGLAGQFGGLASLAGVNLGGAGNNKINLALEIMRSKEFITNFILENELLPVLMAAESWDLDSNTITYNSDYYNATDDEWVRVVKPPFKPKPSAQEGYKNFIEIFSARLDKDTGMVHVSVEHLSPYIATEWVELLIKSINENMRNRDVTEAKKSIEFLREQLEQTNVANIQNVLHKLVEEKMKIIMFARVRDEYVFQTIDKALVPEEKQGPNRLMIVMIGSVIGFVFAVIIVLFQHFIFKDQS